jgi:hypothetical protein
MTNTGWPLTGCGRFRPGAGVGDEHLVAADGGQPGLPGGQRPAAQVGHLEDRQLFLAAAVAGEDLAGAGLGLPEVEQRDAVLAEQAGQEVAAVGRDEAVVGLLAGRVAGGDGFFRIGEIGDADLVGVEEGVHKALAGDVGKPDHPGELARGVFGGHVGEQFEGVGVEGLDAAGFVVLGDDQAAVLGDGAADGVAGLDDALVDAAGQQIDLGEAAVAAENVGVARIAREGDVGVGEIAQAGDGAEAAVRGCARRPARGRRRAR